MLSGRYIGYAGRAQAGDIVGNDIVCLCSSQCMKLLRSCFTQYIIHFLIIGWMHSLPYNTPLSCPPPPTFSFSVLLLCTVSNNTRFVMTCVFQINYAFTIVIDIPSDIHMAHLFIIFQDLLKCYLEQKDFSKKNDVFKLIFLEV